MAQIWSLFACSGWAHSATVVVGTTGECAAMVSVLLDGVGCAIHCGGGHDSLGRCSGLFAWLAWAQPAIVEAGTTREGNALPSVRLFGEGLASHCGAGHEM